MVDVQAGRRGAGSTTRRRAKALRSRTTPRSRSPPCSSSPSRWQASSSDAKPCSGAVFQQISGMMQRPAAPRPIREMLAHLEEPSTGLWSTVIGVVVLLISASTVFGQLQSALDEIWRRARGEARRSGLWNFVRARLLSFGMVLGMAFVYRDRSLLSTAVAALGKWWGPLFGEVLGHLLDLALSFGMLTAVFALIYKLRAARAHRVARRLGRRGGHRGALHHRKVGARALPREERRRLELRRVRVARHRCSSGSTTRRRSSCSAPSSRGCTPGHYGSRKGTAQAVEHELVRDDARFAFVHRSPPIAKTVPMGRFSGKSHAGAKLARGARSGRSCCARCCSAPTGPR